MVLARIPVPGEARVELPAGKVRLVYEQAYTPQFNPPPPKLVVEVVGADGGQLRVKRPRLSQTRSVDKAANLCRNRFGTVKVADPGEYLVRAGPDDVFSGTYGDIGNPVLALDT